MKPVETIQIVDDITSYDEEFGEQLDRVTAKAHRLVADHLKEIVRNIGREKTYKNAEIIYALIALGFEFLLHSKTAERPEETFDIYCCAARKWVDREWKDKTIN